MEEASSNKLPSISSTSHSRLLSVPTTYSRWSTPPRSVTKLPSILQDAKNKVRATTDTAITTGKRKKKRRPRRGSESVDKNNNRLKSNTKSATIENAKRRQKSRQRSEHKDSENEGVVKHSNYVKKVANRTDVTGKYSFEKKLGDGNFATVCLAVHKRDNSKWAMKEIDKQNVKGKVYYIENEADLLKHYRHPNICYLKEAFHSPSAYFLVLEYVDNGDLFDAIKARGTFSESLAASIVLDTANALSYLHRNQIIHRDIKPENLLLTKDLQVKLADFGLACKVLGKLYRVCGTPTYVAPEILSEVGYGVEVDIWSLGVITHIMLVGYAPFRSSDREELFRKIRRGDFSIEIAGWELVSDGAKELVKKMLVVQPRERVTARKLLKNKWLNRNNKRREL